MSITLSIASQCYLDKLIYDLQTHYYALKLCVEDENNEWSDVRDWLIYTRVAALEQTVKDLRAFGDALQL